MNTLIRLITKKSIVVLVLCSVFMSNSFTTSAARCNDDEQWTFGWFMSNNGQRVRRTCAWLTAGSATENDQRKKTWCTKTVGVRRRVVRDKCPVACDYCSGDDTDPTCSDFSPRDLSPSNPVLWHDASGTQYNCAYYAKGANCAIFGDGYPNYGYTAKQACCKCGGGNTGPKPPDCEDFSPRDLSPSNPVLWHDESGTQYNCAFYAQGDNCNIYGNGYPNYGYTAKQACCACKE